jgi:hypothetical protein
MKQPNIDPLLLATVITKFKMKPSSLKVGDVLLSFVHTGFLEEKHPGWECNLVPSFSLRRSFEVVKVDGLRVEVRIRGGKKTSKLLFSNDEPAPFNFKSGIDRLVPAELFGD